MVSLANPCACSVVEECRTLGQPTTFRIMVQLPDGDKTITRSYTDLKRLGSRLVLPPGDHAAVPPRRSIGTVLSPTARLQRRAAIEDFLSHALSNPGMILGSNPVEEFLGSDIAEPRWEDLILELPLAQTHEHTANDSSLLVQTKCSPKLPSVGTCVANHECQSSDTLSAEVAYLEEQVLPVAKQRDPTPMAHPVARKLFSSKSYSYLRNISCLGYNVEKDAFEKSAELHNCNQ